MTDHIGYLAFRSDPASDELTDAQWCAQRRLPTSTLVEWKARFPQWAQEALDLRRKRYAEQLSAVDAALIAKAKGGDTRAAALLYARFENWTPKIAEADNKRSPTNKTLAELISEGE